MTDCLFCQPNSSDNKVFIDSDLAYARWDNYPAAKGHAEVTTKRHVVSYFDLTPDEASDVHEVIKQAQEAIDTLHQPDGYTIGVNEGRAAGRTVDHVHIHLLPRRDGDVPDPRGGIRHVLPGTNPDDWAH